MFNFYFYFDRCEPEGAPQPKFIWKKNGNRIASGGKYIIDRNGTRLFINRINMEGNQNISSILFAAYIIMIYGIIH